MESTQPTMALKRIAQEHADLQRDPLEACSAGPSDDENPRRWVGYISGPPDTPYENRALSTAIVFPEDYPMTPFQIHFTTPLSHPNVSGEGEIRLDELEERNWSPVLTVRSILICVQALLSNPEPVKGGTKSEVAKADSTYNPQDHDIESNAAKGSTELTQEPTHYGRRIGGKKYGMDIRRPEFEEYENLTEGEEKDKFFIEKADIIKEL